MRVLLIKTSSMGDLIHTLPALSDAGAAIPHIKFDWVVEDAFVEIPQWHPHVDQVIPVALRRWRKGIFSRATQDGWKSLRKQLNNQPYDIILDAQGLVKSACLSFLASGVRAGLDWHSARENLASLAYQRKYTVNFYQHAIVRMRSLFSQALGYTQPATAPNFGLNREQFAGDHTEKYVVFLHGTTWASKQWPETYWQQLAKLAEDCGYRIKMGGGNPQEVERAQRVAATCSAVDLVPYLSIAAMANLLAHAQAAIAVDTGFGHLAGALGVPTLSIYGATNAAYTGALGDHSLHLQTDFACSPCLNRNCTFKQPAEVFPACYATIKPAYVWQRTQEIMQGV